MLKPEHEFLLPQLNALTPRLHAAFVERVGVNPARFRVLFMLHVLNDTTPTALLRHVTMQPAALTRILKDMERQGLVAVRPDPSDARQKLAALTDEGQALVRRKLPLRDEMVADALAEFEPAELDVLARLLLRLEENLSAIARLDPVGVSHNLDPQRES